MAYVVHVVAQPLFQARVAAPAVNLGVAGEPGAHRVAEIVVRMFFAEFARELGTLGPGAGQAHLAAKDVPELRKLVETEPAEICAERRAARIVRHGPDGAQIPFGVFPHGSELDDDEPLSAETHARLTVKNRPAVAETDREGDEGQQRREQNQENGGNYNVNRSFDEARQAQ